MSAHSIMIPSEQDCEDNTITFPGMVASNAQVLPKVKFKKLTYTIGLNWKITENVMVYGVKRRGYRGGNYNTPLIDPFVSGVHTFQPEVLDDYEIGTNHAWRAGQVPGHPTGC